MVLVINAHPVSGVINYRVSKPLILVSARNLRVLYKILKLQQSSCRKAISRFTYNFLLTFGINGNLKHLKEIKTLLFTEKLRASYTKTVCTM